VTSDYLTEIPIAVSKPLLVYLLTDPYYFSGVTGHISVFKVYDEEARDFLPPSKVRGPANKFRVSVLVNEDRLKVLGARMEGPELFVDVVSYKFSGGVKGVVEFTFRQREGKLTVSIYANMEYKGGLFLSRKANLAEHVVRDHLVPFISSLREIAIAKRASDER
jgi:hypothetical protein